jgi:hypothetical protein
LQSVNRWFAGDDELLEFDQSLVANLNADCPSFVGSKMTVGRCIVLLALAELERVVASGVTASYGEVASSEQTIPTVRSEIGTPSAFTSQADALLRDHREDKSDGTEAIPP